MRTKNYNTSDLFNFAIICMFISFFLIGLICINKVEFPGSTSDELAYLSQAARYAGMGNASLMQYYAFYGQGISLLWVPFFRIYANSPITIYHAIIMLNCSFLAVSFVVAYTCGKKIYPKWNRWFLLFACYLVSLYPCNLYYMQLALPENLLWLLCWVAYFFYIEILSSHKWYSVLLFAITISFMLIVHFRTIIIVGIVCILFIFLCYKKQINICELGLFLCGILCGYVLFRVLKDGHFEYVGGSNEITSTNIDFSYIDIVKNLLFNLCDYLTGIVFQLYCFLIVGSFPIVYWGMCFFKNMKRGINIKKLEIDAIFIFQALLFFSNIFAVATAQLNPVNRYDKVVYMRYMENVMGPILLSGIYYFFCNEIRIRYKTIIVYTILMEMTTILIYQKMLSSSSSIFAVDSSVGIGSWIGFYPSEQQLLDGLFIAYAFSTIICIAITFFKEKNIKNLHVTIGVEVFALSIICLFWGIIGIKANEFNYGMRDNLKKEYYAVVDEIEKLDRDKIIYIRDREKHSTCLEGKYLQWALGNKYLFEVVDDYEIADSVTFSRDVIYICSPNTNVDGLQVVGVEQYYVNQKMELYITED